MIRRAVRALLAAAWGFAGPSARADATADALARLQSPQGAEAALELARGGPAIAPVFEAALARPDPRPAALCAWALEPHPCPDALAPLRTAVKSRRQVLAYWAARALGRLGRPEAVPDLVALVPEKSDYFSEYDPVHDPATGRPRVPLKPTDRPDPFAPDDMPNIRATYAALLALGDLGTPEAEATLARAAGHGLYLVRHAAARGLGAMRATNQLARLRALAAEDPVLIVRRAAAAAAGRIAGIPPPPEAPPPPWPEALLFIQTTNRLTSNLGFRDSYPFRLHDLHTPWYHAGENLLRLSPVWPPEAQRVTNLTRLERGAVQGPEISYDGRRVLFAMRRDATRDGFHLFEMNVDGTGLRQLTDGNGNDVDPCYLPDGRILFCSDRAGWHEQYHQERSRVLFVMEPDGSGIRPVTFNPNGDYEPLVLRNGLVLYSSYRFYAQDGSPGPLPGEGGMARFETVLRSIRPDGSGDDLFYGAMRGSYYVPFRPFPTGLIEQGWHARGHHIGVAVSQARELPDGRVVCITPAGLTVVDPSLRRTDCEEPMFPEILNLAGGEELYIFSHDEWNPIGRYTTPYPAAPADPLAAGTWVYVAHAPWHDLRLNGYGLWLFDLATRRQIKVFDDPALSEIDPLPVLPRQAPPALVSNLPANAPPLGRILCTSVFRSDLPFDRAAVKQVRVLATEFQPISINANASFRTRSLGETPLDADGSFQVEVPADTPLRFELLDADGRVLVHETEVTYVRPGETRGCVGCHEPKDQPAATGRPRALDHPPARLHAHRGDPVFQGRPAHAHTGILRE